MTRFRGLRRYLFPIRPAVRLLRFLLLLSILLRCSPVLFSAPAIAQSSRQHALNANAPDTLSPPQLKNDLNRILGSSEFQPDRPEKNFLTKAVQQARKYWDRLLKWFHNLFQGGGILGGSNTITGVIVTLLICGLAWIVYRLGRDFSRRLRPNSLAFAPLSTNEEELADIVRDPEVWFKQATEYADRKEYPLAYRALFLATLLQLDHAKIVAYDRSRTNGDYLRSLQHGAHRGLGAVIAPLVSSFDRFYYGHAIAQENDYLTLRDVYQRLPSLLNITNLNTMSTMNLPPASLQKQRKGTEA